VLAWWPFFRTSSLLKIITNPDAFGQRVGELLAPEAAARSDITTLSPSAH
jgi:hypothetical protein